MLTLLRDPVWQFVGAVIAFGATVVAVTMTLRQRRQKRLTYSLRTYLLATVHGDIKTRVSILYDGNPVKDVRLVQIEFKNTGNVPIATQDFERPLRIAFNKKSRILTAEITESIPSDLGPAIDTNWSKGVPEVVVEPLLLNPSDSFIVKLLLAGSVEYEVSARIVGVGSVEIERPRRRYEFFLPIYLLGSLTGALLGAVAMRSLLPENVRDKFLLATAIVALIYGSISYFRSRRRH